MTDRVTGEQREAPTRETAAARAPGRRTIGSRPAGGPARPTTGAWVAHRPLPGTAARLDGGLLGEWQVRNREVSLPAAVEHLRTAGNLENLQLAAAGASTGYRGPAFMDSDLYKTLEAVGWELGRTADETLAAFTDEAVALLRRAQLADGYLNSFIQVSGQASYEHLERSHELYCAGHLIQAGIAHARATGATRLLEVAQRFADQLARTFLGTNGGPDGHPVVESALVELYRQLGDPRYLHLAQQFIDQRGHGLVGDYYGFGRRYLQDHLPVQEAATVTGHAVRALYLEAGVADVAAETGDARLLASSITRWNDMIATKTAITGGNGSRHDGESFGDAYELPPDRAYNETCAAIASFQWSWRLLLATGQSKYADLMERLLYNGLAASVSADGRRFFYVNPLQRRTDHFEGDDPGRRREWFTCACCPPNIMRLLASLHHYLATTAGDGLYVHLFAGSHIEADVAGGRLTVEVDTGYPWHGEIRLRVTRAPGRPCGLAVRRPGWAGLITAALNGEPVSLTADEHGYLIIRRRWRPGDALVLTLPMRPALAFPDRRIDALRGTAALVRGPVTYCIEQADQPPGVSLEDLAVLPRPPLLDHRAAIPGIGQTVAVEASAVVLPQGAGPGGLPYRDSPSAATEPSDQASPGTAGEMQAVTIRAIPYFQWDNRDRGAMRVWVPVHDAYPPARDQPRARSHPAG